MLLRISLAVVIATMCVAVLFIPEPTEMRGHEVVNMYGGWFGTGDYRYVAEVRRPNGTTYHINVNKSVFDAYSRGKRPNSGGNSPAN